MKAYLDNSATTKPSAAVAAVVSEMLESGWYNPSALYKPALEIQKRIDGVRETCLKAAGAAGQVVIFTSGGTEADNLALLGHLKSRRKLPGGAVRHAFPRLRKLAGGGLQEIGRHQVPCGLLVREANGRNAALVVAEKLHPHQVGCRGSPASTAFLAKGQLNRLCLCQLDFHLKGRQADSVPRRRLKG